MKKSLRRILLPFAFLIAALKFIENIASFFKCPGMADESWLLYITHNQVPSQFSFFTAYCAFLRDCSFIGYRAFFMVARILSGAFLGWTFYRAFKKRLELSRMDGCVMALVVPCLLSTSQTVGVPSYMTLNFILGCLSFGFLLLAASEDIFTRLAFVAAAASGAMISQLIFIMPTNMVIVPLMMLALFFINRKRVLPFVIGCGLGIGFFFACVCRPTEFMSIVDGFRKLDYATTDGHDIMMLVKWLIRTAFVYIPVIVMGFVLDRALCGKRDEKKGWRIFFWIALLGAALVHAVSVLSFGIYIFSMVRIDFCVMYLVLFALCFRHMREDSVFGKDSILFALFMLAPLCLSFGTNVEFDHRGGRYMIFLLLPLWGLTRKYASDLGRGYLLLMGLLYLFLMGAHLPLPCGYSGIRLIDSRCSLAEFGSNCRTSESQLRDLAKLRDATVGRNTLIGGRDSWRAVVLLKKTPLSMLWYKPESLMEILTNTPANKDDSFILEQKGSFELTPKLERQLLDYFGGAKLVRRPITDTCSVVTFE